MVPHFDQIAFSGGGIRCFWHGGFLCEVGNYDDLCPERVTGVSGGALSAAAWIGAREQDLYDLMREAFRINDANIRATRKNLTPHETIYRAVVSTTLDDEAIGRIAEGPDFDVAVSVPPRWMPAGAAAAFYAVLYQLDQRTRATPHLVLPCKAGLRQLRIDARQASRDGKLVDVICAAATIPPVFTVPEWEGSRVLDGGMCEKVILPDPDEGESLVLLTRRYRNLPSEPRRTYVQPSRTVAADKIDFTCEDKVTRTWEQGQADARDWLAQIS